MKFYSISEFAKLIYVSVQALRLWDKSGILKPHHKTPGGNRCYSDEQIEEYFKLSEQKN
jgi:putative resolvase